MGDVITAITEAGLHIEYLNEYDESSYGVFSDLVKSTNDLYVTKGRLYLLLFEIKATKG